MSGAARRAAWLALALALPLILACMRAVGGASDPRNAAPAVDSLTVALWHFDEVAGTRCADAGPSRIAATAGEGTRISYGRFGSAREFTRATDSFVYAPDDPALDASGGLTIEAWVLPHAFGSYEDTPIAARWTEEGTRQSWLFGIVGLRLAPPATPSLSPGYHDAMVARGQSGQLVFAFQPQDASPMRAFVSSQRLALERWAHVAVSFDGRVVRFFIDGRLDAQYATPGRIRSSAAPVLVGNYFDTRGLTSFSGELKLQSGADEEPWYAFEGMIDELRISDAARVTFPGTGVR